MSELIFQAQFPEPLRCWIAHAPGRWPGPDGWWLDLAREEAASEALRSREPAMQPVSREVLTRIRDVAYLPPVGAIASWWLQDVRGSLREREIDAIVQILPGEPLDAGWGTLVLDLTPALLPPKFELIAAAPRGVHCCWPLIAGLTDDPELWERGLGLLARAHVASVQPVEPALSPVDKRRLGELTNRRGYQELFHGAAPDARSFAQVVHQYGLSCFLPRPNTGYSGRALRNRRIATRLHLIGELILRTKGSVDESLSFYRAARWVDAQALDVEDLARTGNLEVVPWLSAACRQELESLVEGSESPRFERLQFDYRGERAGSAPTGA